MTNDSKRRANHLGQNGVEPNKPEWNFSDFDLDDFLDLDLGEDEPVDWSDFEPLQRLQIDMDVFVQQLADENFEIPDERLMAFSDLSRSDAEIVRASWTGISDTRRQWIAQRLAELYLTDMRINLERFWRIALHDDNAHVRESAVRGLAGEVYEDLVGSFVQLLLNDPDEEVRAAAASVLGSYVLAGELDELDAAQAMRAEEALLDILHNEDEPLDVRARALESIAFSGEVGVRQLIEEAYYAEDEELRVSAVVAMGRSADVRWRGKVCAELHNASPIMRSEAAYACGELEALDALRDLMELLDDEHEAVRLATIFALGRLGGPEARAALQALADAPESLESVAAEDALEEMQFFARADAVPLLNELMDDGEWEEDEWEEWADMLGGDDLRDFVPDPQDRGVDIIDLDAIDLDTDADTDAETDLDIDLDIDSDDEADENDADSTGNRR